MPVEHLQCCFLTLFCTAHVAVGSYINVLLTLHLRQTCKQLHDIQQYAIRLAHQLWCYVQIQSQARKLNLAVNFLGAKDHIHEDLHAYQVGSNTLLAAPPFMTYTHQLVLQVML